jgi:hypothetical protein
MRSQDLISLCENLTHRKIDYWCQQGIFADDAMTDGRRTRREFSDEDLQVALVLARVSAAFDRWSNGRGGFIAIYREVARQVRAGTHLVQISLAEGIEFTINVVAPASAAEPLPEFVDDPIDEVVEEVVEPNYIPGVGVDNA